MTKLLLASTSTYRATLLKRLNIPFETASPGCDETPLDNESPQSLAARLAADKAQSLALTYPDKIIIGSDQVASLGKEILGKPGTADCAIAQLKRMNGQSVIFYTAVSVLHPSTKAHDQFIDHTTATLRTLSTQEITRYIAADSPLNCAGSFMIESLGISLFDKVETTDPTALVGLPLIKLCRSLRKLGVEVP